MGKEIEVEVAGDDRARLEAIVADRNCPQEHVERVRIVSRSHIAGNRGPSHERADGLVCANRRTRRPATVDVERDRQSLVEQGAD
jgi:hypothetical protein